MFFQGNRAEQVLCHCDAAVDRALAASSSRGSLVDALNMAGIGFVGTIGCRRRPIKLIAERAPASPSGAERVAFSVGGWRASPSSAASCQAVLEMHNGRFRLLHGKKIEGSCARRSPFLTANADARQLCCGDRVRPSGFRASGLRRQWIGGSKRSACASAVESVRWFRLPPRKLRHCPAFGTL